ncbi:MAG TPA: aminotransferase class I/II-fold pyridoxal phosphate-dependent enzyme, partial [Anaerolineales bacterium]
ENNLGIPEYDAPLARTTRRGVLDYEVDWDAFERQITKAGMFLLCNPHNPVGKIFSRGDLRRMAKTCIENDVVIVSDEIHSELLLDDEKFIPVATLSRDIERHTITLVSASKTFNVPGLFCGFAIVPDPRLRERMAKVIDALKMHTNSLGLSAAQAAFSGKCDPWLRALRKYLTGNRDFLIEYARDYLPDIRLTRPQATYLEWLDCGELVSSVRIEGSPFQFFLDEAKLALADGKLYAGDHPDFVRLNFGCPRSTLERGLERMRKALYR